MTLYIAVEGPIGVGKSSLTTKLAKTLNMDTLYEIVEENPFLSEFYEDIAGMSFQTEMFFLCNRYKQINDLKDKSVISDYHIFKNKIFAKNTLNNKEYRMFEQIYDIITQEIRLPDFTIILSAELPVLKQRIQRRNRDFEAAIEDNYLEKLIMDYKHIYNELNNDRTLYIDTTNMDFVHNNEDYEKIVEQIKKIIGAYHD